MDIARFDCVASNAFGSLGCKCKKLAFDTISISVYGSG
jgi:hypothetical protein